jgi:hypothetical protein
MKNVPKVAHFLAKNLLFFKICIFFETLGHCTITIFVYIIFSLKACVSQCESRDRMIFAFLVTVNQHHAAPQWGLGLANN